MALHLATVLIPILGKVIDSVFPDPVKKQEVIERVQLELLANETSLTKALAETVQAEIKGESWLQRNWRPITMLGFNAAIMGYWFGLTPELPQYAVEQMFSLLQIGVGGYIVGRSAEKISTTVSGKGVVENVLENWRKPSR